LKNIDGNNLAPLIQNTNENYNDRIIYNHWQGRTSLRTQKFRLDDEDRLYNMINDPQQSRDIGNQFPKIRDSLVQAKERWLLKYPPLTNATDDRPFTLGHPEFGFTQLPARDGIPHGQIKRSNRYPNNTFFTNWTNAKDSITWDVDVLQKGTYEATLYYTLPQGDTGVTIHLNQGTNLLSKTINQENNPPLKGMENDRVERMESYVKEFKPLVLGNINLDAGRQLIVLKASDIKNKCPEIRLLQFERKD